MRPRQRGQQLFEFVDFLLLLVDDLVERINGVLLMRQFQFDVDQTFFVDHGVFSFVAAVSASVSPSQRNAPWAALRPLAKQAVSR